MRDLFGGLSDPMSGATISECGRYRYRLWRTWDLATPQVNFLMLNPSTADASEDDATIRRCLGFARAWGFGGIMVTNLYALRSTDPKGLWLVSDPVGPLNDEHLVTAALTSGRIVCAWGAGARPERAARVRALLGARIFEKKPPHHLGLTKAGHPKHPLYLPASAVPIPWETT